MAKKQQWWTVIFGVITNTGNIDTFTVRQSGTQKQAVKKAQEAYFDEYDLERGETLQLIGLIEGKHYNDVFDYKFAKKKG